MNTMVMMMMMMIAALHQNREERQIEVALGLLHTIAIIIVMFHQHHDDADDVDGGVDNHDDGGHNRTMSKDVINSKLVAILREVINSATQNITSHHSFSLDFLSIEQIFY